MISKLKFRKAVIFGIKGKKLSLGEINILKKSKPWGIILFSRNITNINQLKLLIQKIRSVTKDKKFPILIDQEGGVVSRLNSIVDLSIFSQEYFGNLYKNNRRQFFAQYKVYIDVVAEIMNNVGININTVPVLDLKRKISNKVIGTRSFSSDKNIVKNIGNICINFFYKKKISTVMKHIPGHGHSNCDSHYKLPIIKLNKKKLSQNDFFPFKKCNSFFAMTAHIIYQAFDKKFPATHSKIIIKDLIRKNMEFKGILISDDISMKALKYGLKKNALNALNAGCNLVLHCNGNIKEMNTLSKIIPTVDKFTLKKTSQFYKFLG